MADNENNDAGGATDEKLFNADQVSKIVQDRLRQGAGRKDDNNSQMAQRLEALEATIRQLSAQQPGQAQAPEAPATGGAPMTQESLQAALQSQTEAQQAQAHQAQTQQALNYHQQNVAQLSATDPSFKKLVDKSDGLQVPLEVSTHISNSFTPEQSKKIFTELLTNENTNLKMKNAYLEEMQTPESGMYQTWLRQLTNQSISDGKTPEPVPELQQGSATAQPEGDLSNVMSYMKGL